MKLTKVIFLLIAVSCAGLAQQESLLISSGDVLKIDVFETPEMAQTPKVTDAGTIPLLLLGDLRVEGLTPGQAAQAIESGLKAKGVMIHPQVSVVVTEYAKRNIFVMGQVNTPGPVVASTPTSLLKVLASAGGLTDLADRNITIEQHGDPNQKLTYFLSNNSDAAIEKDVMVNPGDIVLVPKAGLIYILGDVGRPGGYPMTTNDSKMSLLQALAMAGSPEKTALLSKAKLVRKTPSGPTEMALDLSAIQKGKSPDVSLQADDILFVPFSYMKNVVIGSSTIGASAASALIYAHP